jgi:Ca2+-binding RTX toxin-like protein
MIELLEARRQFSSVSIPGIASLTISARGTLMISGTSAADSIDVYAVGKKAVGTIVIGAANTRHLQSGMPSGRLVRKMDVAIHESISRRNRWLNQHLPSGTSIDELQTLLNDYSTGQWIFVYSEATGNGALVQRSIAQRVAVDAGAGNDTIGQGEAYRTAKWEPDGVVQVGNLPCTLMGGKGDDFIRGGGEGDVLSGGAGDDVLLDMAGTAGPTILFGGLGDDRLLNEKRGYGAVLRGGLGNDRAYYPEADASGVERFASLDEHGRPVFA